MPMPPPAIKKLSRSQSILTNQILQLRLGTKYTQNHQKKATPKLQVVVKAFICSISRSHGTHCLRNRFGLQFEPCHRIG